MTKPHDPYETRRLPPLTQTLAQPVQIPLAAIVALVITPALIIGSLLVLWTVQRQPPAPTQALLPSPTIALPAVTTVDQGLPRATVAYDAPRGAVLGALEPGRVYSVVARAGLDWVQLDVNVGGAPNLVWVVAGDVPEIQAAAGLADLATPEPSSTTQMVYVAAPAPEPPAPTPLVEHGSGQLAELIPMLPSPTASYLLPPATPAIESVVRVSYPTPTPCPIGRLGSIPPCHGYVR